MKKLSLSCSELKLLQPEVWTVTTMEAACYKAGGDHRSSCAADFHAEISS